MVGANLKQETMILMDKRTGMEAEMEAIIARLCRPNGPGISGNLVDAEGFPRADFDIPAVRADRQRLIVVRNDHKEITLKIEQNLHVLHSGAFSRESSALPQKRTADGEESRPQRTSAATEPSASFTEVQFSAQHREDAVIPMEDDALPMVPFAVFDEVSEGSPAQQDGLILGDWLIKFGNVMGGENLLPRLAAEGHRNQGCAVHVVVLRQGLPVHLSITPRPWSGRGLLGCHIWPL